MGNKTSSLSITDQNFLKDTVLNSLSETNISNIMTTRIKNTTTCSSSTINTSNIGNNVNNSKIVEINYSNISVDQSITYNLSCLSDDKIFNQLINDISNKIIADLKNISNTDLKNFINNKLTSELGNLGSTESKTISKIVTNEQSNNNLLNRVSSIVSNKLDTENNKKCIIGNINTSNIGGNYNNQDIVRLNFGGINVKQSITTLSNCMFSTDVKNAIANTITNELVGKTDSVQNTKSSNAQDSTTESKGIGGMFKSILDGIGGVISSSMGLFIILGILGLGFLYYMAKGGGNELVRDKL